MVFFIKEGFYRVDRKCEKGRKCGIRRRFLGLGVCLGDCMVGVCLGGEIKICGLKCKVP